MKTKLIWLSLIAATCLVAWTNALDVSNGSGKNFFPQIISDGAGGAIISWLKKTDDCYEVYAQRVSTNPSGLGYRVWSNSVNISADPDVIPPIGHRLNHHIVPSTDNGAIYFWANHFDITNYHRGYYLQRTNATGGLTWNDEDPVQVLTTHYVPASSLEEDGDPISVCPDGQGGCVVVMKIFDVTLINDIIVSAVLKGYNKPQTNPFVGF